MKQNDPVRVKKAWIRLICAVLAAVVLLAVSGFGVFKMLAAPKSLAAEDLALVEPAGSGEAEPVSAGPQTGDFVEHEVNIILGNFAEGFRGDTAVERYGVVPVSGRLVAFCFPQRWLASEKTIADSTQDIINGVAYDLDKYIIVRGTVEPLSESVAEQLYSWFGENQEWMTQMGLTAETDDAAQILADYVVHVDQVGRLPMAWVVGLSAAAGVCLLYALYELIRILAKGYAVKTAEAPAAETESAADEDVSDIDVEITETDPESGEDVTDLEVEITQEEPTDDAEA